MDFRRCVYRGLKSNGTRNATDSLRGEPPGRRAILAPHLCATHLVRHLSVLSRFRLTGTPFGPLPRKVCLPRTPRLPELAPCVAGRPTRLSGICYVLIPCWLGRVAGPRRSDASCLLLRALIESAVREANRFRRLLLVPASPV